MTTSSIANNFNINGVNQYYSATMKAIMDNDNEMTARKLM
jgi:hypothetical protein